VAVAVQDQLKELSIEQKLLAITGDNASNNGTLCHALYKGLSESYSGDPLANSSIRSRMRFHGRKSFIRCLAHITNLICDDILKELKSSTGKEAKALLDNLTRKGQRGSGQDSPDQYLDSSKHSTWPGWVCTGRSRPYLIKVDKREGQQQYKKEMLPQLLWIELDVPNRY
jgi:hypothetical protein